MAADTYSSILGYLVMGTGNDTNAWGDNCNNSVFAILEKAIAAMATHAVTGGTLDLSGSPPPAAASQVVEMVHKFTGVLASTQIFIIPNLQKVFVVWNATSGNFGLLVKTPSGTAVNAPAGKLTILICDGANNVKRRDAEEVGKYSFGASATIPSGEFECDGSTKLIADYPDLYARIGTLYGGNGTTNFILPDLKTAGRFLRSRTGSITVGTAQADTLASHTHTASATTSVTVATDGAHSHVISVSDPGHLHQVSFSRASVASGSGFANCLTDDTSGSTVTFNSTSSVTNIAPTASTSGSHTHSATAATTVTVVANGSSETRPINYSALVTIAY